MCYTQDNNLPHNRVATVRVKYLVNETFSRSVDGQGNLERPWKVREKSGNLKINGWASRPQKIYLFCSRGKKDVLSHEIV